MLTYLVERHGRLVAKPELIEAVWPGANVTDNSLAQCLKEIRRALGDDSQELVRTVARRGYLVNAVAAPAVGVPQSAPSVRRNFVRGFAPAAGLLLALAAAGLISRPVTSPQEVRNAYTQLTNFPDSAVGPALSPDGKTLAFLRSESAFLSPGQIYVKQLPNGEPVQVTHDPRTKYGPAFSPDGSLLGFSLMGGPAPSDWATYVVSPQGGSPRLLLRNASGLTWIDRRRLLFSEIGSGMHMGIVTAAENRSEARNVYWPRDERAMAHFSYASPNRKWALVVEMNPAWEPCRLVPLDGTSAGSKVGPQGACTSAAWSPDGQWMYFGSTVDGSGHLWRQRFPDGKPELITAGPTEEEGIAVAPDGRSLITSVGMRQSAVWLHDSRGERPISTEGFALDVRQGEGFGAAPVFAADGKSVYYLLRRQSRESPKTLWRADLASEKSAEVLSGASIHEYDISNDGKQVVYSTREPGENSRIWLAPLDRASAAKPVAFVIGTGASPRFGPDGEILFRDSDGKSNYLARMNPDGSGRARVSPYPIGTIQTISGDRRWIAAIAPVHGDSAAVATVAVPLNGDPARRICATVCSVAWARDGRFIYISLKEPSPNQRGTTVALQLRPGDVLPPLPSSGIRWLEDGSGLPGATLIDNARIVPGPDPSTYAIVRAAVQRNLFRIPLPRR